MKKIIVGAMFVLLGATTAQAVEIPLETKVENRLMSAFGPMLKVRSVEPLANQQLLEVILIDGATVHMTPDTNYFIFNDSLYQLTPTGAENITENRLNPKRAAALKKVADKDTVYFPAKGKQKAVIDVFTDIDCPYCQKLHDEVPRLNELGVTVRYLAYPRSGIVNPQSGEETSSYRKINHVWCSENSAKEMTLVKNNQAQLGYLSRLMAENKGTAAQKDELQKLTRSMSNIVKNSKNCDSPVAHQYELGHELGVKGTPAIFTEDGSLIPGYMPADELARRIGL